MDLKLKEADRFIAYINRHKILRSVLQAEGARRLKNTSPTRWYSANITVKSLLDAKEALLDMNRESPFGEFEELFHDSEFWSSLEDMRHVLDPLCDVIAICEANDTNISQAYHSLLQFGKICYEQSHIPIMA